MSSITIFGLNEITDTYLKATTGVVLGLYINVLIPFLFIAYFYVVLEKTGITGRLVSMFNSIASSAVGSLVFLSIIPLAFSFSVMTFLKS